MTELDDLYWSNRYADHTCTWDAGAVTTPLKDYFDQLTDKNIAILVPGCGNSYEAEYLLKQGFTNITLIDISTTLCKKLEVKFAAYLSLGLTIICTDFFDHHGQYDLVIEQTFFCALHPSKRNAYVEKIHEILKLNGKLAGVLFNKDFSDGPPFGGHIEEYETLFSGTLLIETMDRCYNSIPPRKEAELFIKMIRKPPVVGAFSPINRG
ncbi:MAG: methyltransferase domain-containing protein [Ferruginibacter sp.]